MKPNIVVLTGGPCAGKSAILAHIKSELTKRGFVVLVVEETATELSQMGVNLGHDDQGLLQRHILNMQLQKENRTLDMAKYLANVAQDFSLGKKAVVLCDRGIMDQRAYMEKAAFESLLQTNGITSFDALHRYTGVLHLRSAAAEHYTQENNDARSETHDYARELDEKTLAAWVGTPHLRVFPNETDFEHKKSKVLQEVLNLLGVDSTLEIERKWLLDPETTESFLANPPVDIYGVDILQFYLADGSRLRTRTVKNAYVGHYTRTLKTEVSPGVNIEEEQEISVWDYRALNATRDSVGQLIYKTRHVFVWQNRYWELDRFETVGGDPLFYMLETEFTPGESLDVPIPDFLTVIREVTQEKEFKNKVMAISGFPTRLV